MPKPKSYGDSSAEFFRKPVILMRLMGKISSLSLLIRKVNFENQHLLKSLAEFLKV